MWLGVVSCSLTLRCLHAACLSLSVHESVQYGDDLFLQGFSLFFYVVFVHVLSVYVVSWNDGSVVPGPRTTKSPDLGPGTARPSFRVPDQRIWLFWDPEQRARCSGSRAHAVARSGVVARSNDSVSSPFRRVT